MLNLNQEQLKYYISDFTGIDVLSFKISKIISNEYVEYEVIFYDAKTYKYYRLIYTVAFDKLKTDEWDSFSIKEVNVFYRMTEYYEDIE